MTRRLLISLLCLGMALMPRNASAEAAPAAPAIPDLDAIEQYVLPKVDPQEIRLADEQRVAEGRVAHYAVPFEVRIDALSHTEGWLRIQDEMARWRLRITSPGALSLNLAFGSYKMPAGGRLVLTSADGRHRIGPFTERDNEDHGELWTPPIPTDDLILEVTLPFDEVTLPPDGLGDFELKLTKVHHGYAGFGEAPPKAGDCHVDVACSEAGPWSDQVRSVGLISVEGVRFCTGFLINNTALDGRPLFMTADHCSVSRGNAASVVVIWSHQRATCGDSVVDDTPEPTAVHFQTGAYWRASHRSTDAVLLELDDPPDPASDVYFAGWDRSPADPARSVVIHHPNTDFKRISFDSERAVTTWHLRQEPHTRGNHLRIADWDLGTTEGGSSGAPLFNQDRRIVGQLHGGQAACGNRRSDWFGRLSAAWPSLRDWLDPIASEALTLDGLDGAALQAPR